MSYPHTRVFPQPGIASRQILLPGLIACALGLAAGSGHTGAATDTVEGVSQQLEETQDRLRLLDEEIARGRALKSSLQQTLADADSRAGERAARVEDLAVQIGDYETRLTELEARVARERATLGTRKDALGAAIGRSRRIDTGVGLKVLLQHDDPALADRLGVYTDYLLDAQRRAIDVHVEVLESVEAAREVALKDRNWLNYIKKKAAQQQLEFADKGGETQTALSDVENRLVEKSRTVAQLTADRQRLQTLMRELETAAARGSGYFASNKGQYSLPVKGRIEARFGEAKSVGRINWDGLFIEADSGTSVRAIADGEVVFANWLTGFGMLVIIDHGDSYMTLYGGNRELVVDAGSYVESGVTIATVGDSGGQKTSGVYFEIRHNARPVNPTPWLSTQNGA